MQTGVNGLSIVPANSHLAGAEVELVNMEDREQRLKEALAEVSDRYGTILLDCPPALGLLTINAMVAAHSVLIPVQCEYYAMEGLGRLMESIQRLRQSLNPGLEIEGIVPVSYTHLCDIRLRASRRRRSAVLPGSLSTPGGSDRSILSCRFCTETALGRPC